MKKLVMMIALIGMLLTTAAHAAELQYPNSMLFGLPEGPGNSAAILVDLPQDTIMVELVSFEDGDYIQTFQLPDGVTVQILRYAQFDMTLEELAEGEWTGYTSLKPLAIEGLDRLITEGVHLKTSLVQENGTPAYDVYIVRAQTNSPDQVHLLQAVFPSELGEERIEEEAGAMLDSILIMNLDLLEWG